MECIVVMLIINTVSQWVSEWEHGEQNVYRKVINAWQEEFTPPKHMLENMLSAHSEMR